MQENAANAELVSDLRQELSTIVNDGTEIWQRQDRAQRVRFCRWDGQSDDGRKHAADLGEDAWPFEGAADTRVPLVDSVINDKVAFACQAFWRAQVQALPVDASDAARAEATTTLLRWLRDRALRAELQVEVELAAQYLYGDDPGVVVVEVQWWRDLMVERRAVTFDELAGMYASGARAPGEVSADDARIEAELLADFSDVMVNPLREREALAWLGATFAGVAPGALRRALRALRREGRAELPVPTVRENRPCVQALRLFDDVFFPIGTADLQRARSIHRREWLSEVELRERVVTLGWAAAWVDAVIERGRGQTIVDGELTRRSLRNLSLSYPGGVVNERDNLFEVWWSYERRADELGIPGIYCTVWNAQVKDRAAKSELVDYPHGKYPFVFRGRERLGRQVTEARGAGRAIETHQLEVKIQRDARSNYTQLATTPPRKVKMSRGAWDLLLGPGANIPVQRSDDFEYVAPPPFPQASIEIERTTRAEVDDYVGRMSQAADKDRVAALTQHEIDNFFALWREVFGQVLALAQGYYSEIDLARITGPSGEALMLSPDDIRGSYDAVLEIDARDLNMEYAMKKMDAYGRLLALDPIGILDRAPLVAWGAAAFDPILARRTVRAEANVSQREVEAEKGAVAQLAAGIEAAMPTQGINARLRLQTLLDTINQSPKLRAQYQADEGFRELADNRVKYLNQQVAQEENKVIGRIGTMPVQGGGESMGAPPA